MPRRRSRQARSRRNARGNSGVRLQAAAQNVNMRPVKFAGSVSYKAAVSATPNTYSVSNVVPTAFCTRLVTMGSIFNMCRCTRLRFTFMPDSTTSTVVAAYSPFIHDATVTTLLQVSEWPLVVTWEPSTTVPAILDIPKRALSFSPFKWFPTKVDPVIFTSEMQQGFLALVSSSTQNLTVQLNYEYEFCGPNASGYEVITPRPLQMPAVSEQKEDLSPFEEEIKKPHVPRLTLSSVRSKSASK